MFKQKYFFSLITIQEIARTVPYSFLALYIIQNGFALDTYSFVKSLSLVSIFLFEVPSGFISDKFGRKRTWVFSILLLAISFSFYLSGSLLSTFFYFAEIFYGIGFACLTGTLKSSKINEIKKFSKPYLRDYFFELKIVQLIARTIGSILGSTIFFYTKFNPFFISISLFGFLLIYSYWYKDYQPKNKEIAPKFKLQERIREFRNTKLILFFISVMLMQFIVIPVYHYWQPIFKESTTYYQYLLTYAFLIFNGIGILGTYIGKRFLKGNISIYVGMIILGLPLVSIGFTNFSFITIILFLVSRLGQNIYEPQFRHSMQLRIKDNQRGFLTSFISSLSSSTGTVIFLLTGLIINQNISILTITSFYSGFFLIVNSLFIYFIFFRKK